LNLRPEAFAGLEVEGNYLVPGDTIEIPVRSESETTRLAECGPPVWRKDTDEMAIRRMVFPNGGHGIGRTEGVFARNKNIPVRC